MNKTIDIKSHFPRFKWITTLTPGHLYEDEKGVEIIFIGFGSLNDYMKEDNGLYTYNRWGHGNSFLYIKKKKLMSYIHKEIIINSNKFKNIINQLMLSNKGEICDIVNFSQKPRKFVKDLGEYFPQDINPEIIGYFESDKYEHDYDKDSNHCNINGNNCRFGNYWIFDFR